MLVVDADAAMRRMVRLGLELDGAAVVEATSITDARRHLASGRRWAGVVIDPLLPDGDPNELSAEVIGAPVVMFCPPDELDAAVPDAEIPCVDKADMAALLRALNLVSRSDGGRLAVVDLLLAEAEEVEADWRELCKWDPMLPPDSQPPIAAAVIAGIAEALGRPQPLGWGADPEVEKVAEVFATAVGAIDIVIGQLVCLREVVRRRITTRVAPDELAETDDRLHMVIDRAITVAACHTAERLQEQAYTDSLTGLMNRRALERDLRREAGRAARYGRRFGLVVIDMDGLKAVNDNEGHLAGDLRLRGLADAIQESLRIGDAAYRVGGDEFVVLLPETDDAPLHAVIERIEAAGAPPFSWGSVAFPDDGQDLLLLLDTADARLFEKRRAVRGAAR
ncbi:MAG TPA: diguanylate cyclase [Acidimicrobiales bacterium]|nr:diguanylate cyclase [Acidimicrobiales bacterium]